MLSIGPRFFLVASAANELRFFHPMDDSRGFPSFYFVLRIFFCLHLFRVFFPVGCLPQCILLRYCLEPSFSFARARISSAQGLFSCVSVIAALTLFIMFICLLLIKRASCPLHIHYSP